MATRTPASIVKWDGLVGSLEPGKRADLLIIDAPPDTDVYAGLIAARETAVQLVVIDGRAVVGEPALMSLLGAAGETLTVGDKPRVIDYGPGDPKVPLVTYAEARTAMTDALQRLPHLLADEAAGRGVGPHTLARPGSPWRLALDEQLPTGFALRPRLPLAGEPTGPDASSRQDTRRHSTRAGGFGSGECVGRFRLCQQSAGPAKSACSDKGGSQDFLSVLAGHCRS